VLSGLYFFEHANVKAEKVQRSKVIYAQFLMSLTLQIYEQFQSKPLTIFGLS
jgi:hypothetical protein